MNRSHSSENVAEESQIEEDTEKKEPQDPHMTWRELLIFLLLIYAAWFTCRFFVFPIADRIISSVVVEAIGKGLIFVGPILFYLWRKRIPWLSYLRLRLSWGLLWGICISIAILEWLFLMAHDPTLHSFHPAAREAMPAEQWINVVLLPGLFEEILFRGFIFQQLRSLFHGHFWVAALIASLLFMLMHIPQWLTSSTPFLKYMGIVFVLGMGLCALLQKSKSLWSCALVHTSYNLFVELVSSLPI
jgi:membrane protease YdiL (CAAX protease family)